MPPALILKQSWEKVDEEFLEEHVFNGQIVVTTTTTPSPPQWTDFMTRVFDSLPKAEEILKNAEVFL